MNETFARVAALYDIHGNLPALEAVLEEVDRLAPDVIIVGGDCVMGPMPRETLERLRELGDRARFIRGNTERYVVQGRDPTAGEGSPWAARTIWVAAQLSPRHRDFLAALPETLLHNIEGLGPTLFCHGSPRSDEEIITRATPESRMREFLRGVDAQVVVCGHTHMQFDRIVGTIRVVNAGSVGMPYEEQPGAYWAVLGPEVELRRSLYDVENAAGQMLTSGFPEDDEFRKTFLHPPTANQAVEVFEKMAPVRAAQERDRPERTNA